MIKVNLMTETRRCGQCGTEHPASHFRLCIKKANARFYHNSYCAKCNLLKSRNMPKKAVTAINRQRNNDRAWAWFIYSTYGMTEAQYWKMHASQMGVCAICKDNKSGKRLSVDHCHKTHVVRALLCVRCNLGIGSFMESKTIMAEAIKYLDKFQPIRIA